MSDHAAKSVRSPEAIDRDFAELIASGLPGTVARDKFERLWDEANAIAAEIVLTPQGQKYLSLLKRMHQTFESRYPARRPANGFVIRT
ncbi:hypothetical protein BCh11DRAFT_02986 [Burkholderia sp. Ch1-1]|jgi:hypothetical protein|uniref:Uncharacterized protein n=1 Tax=Paraburkholderia dioscoreae TaxID=2604047 RepID=A0A5Q4ZW01_9BURK|nr:MULTISPECIES: hypothetical protein [Paraburkholderia]EIF35173.1 hypothetical protein BCh11DRAFT_02986 [Burkholderia sp. Ch1-1]MDR8401146.1 hypothetical protein [Paraburkholderia sp. USG1]VVD34382.1 conserved protein of unknown function [Paraburkholderia dioscoreae]